MPPKTELVIRTADPADLPAVQVICAASDRRPWHSEALDPHPDRFAIVAIIDGEIVGAAKTHFHLDADGEAPAGHYLGGIVVTPSARRRGVGFALTRARLDWIWGRSDVAFYFTDEDNEASIRMHETLGFELVTHLASVRGVSARTPGCTMALFRAQRAR